MPFNIVGFAIGRALAEREGVQDADRANRIALIGGVLGPTPVGLVVSDQVARREAETAQPAAAAALVSVPGVIGQTAQAAQQVLDQAQLTSTLQEVVSR